MTIDPKSERGKECRQAIQKLMIESYYSAEGWDERKERQKLIQAVSDKILGPGICYETLT